MGIRQEGSEGWGCHTGMGRECRIETLLPLLHLGLGADSSQGAPGRRMGEPEGGERESGGDAAGEGRE